MKTVSIYSQSRSDLALLVFVVNAKHATMSHTGKSCRWLHQNFRMLRQGSTSAGDALYHGNLFINVSTWIRLPALLWDIMNGKWAKARGLNAFLSSMIQVFHSSRVEHACVPIDGRAHSIVASLGHQQFYGAVICFARSQALRVASFSGIIYQRKSQSKLLQMHSWSSMPCVPPCCRYSCH